MTLTPTTVIAQFLSVRTEYFSAHCFVLLALVNPLPLRTRYLRVHTCDLPMQTRDLIVQMSNLTVPKSDLTDPAHSSVQFGKARAGSEAS